MLHENGHAIGFYPQTQKLELHVKMVYFYLGDRSVVFRSWTQHLDLQSMLLQLIVGVEGFNSYTRVIFN